MTELAPVAGLDETCPACRSGEGIRQTSRTPRVQAWACDRCDTSRAFSVVNPLPFLARIAAAVAERSTTDQVINPAAQQPIRRLRAPFSADYHVGDCGHPVPRVGAVWCIGPCHDCDPSTT